MSDRVKAHSFEDGDNICVNIVDENSSILLIFTSEEVYRKFCEEVADLERLEDDRSE